ncbi:Ribonuclease Trv [Moelleriella libera RCEF 2490]|uniref:ribonuclease T2 n=1 Tax=Moelleriella libera RCEF 2490 TaxID=1081109 RepID=A0A167YTN8_9HYPO|nr:Ribonuclease Trv [Moelleriella libera RCEF 2490]
MCDSKRAYTGIGNILSEAGATNTLAYMKKYWKDYKGDDERFWRHEWGKHGTCISTLSPSCYHRYQAKQEVVDFFQKTVELFRRLPTYQWLAEAGITPSNTKTYSLSQIQRVLTRRHGAEVTLNCKGKALKEVWYHYNVKGSLQTGRFIATQPDGTKGRCPPMVQYQPKTGGGVSPPGGGRGGRDGDGDGDGGRRGGGKKKKGKGRKGRGRGGRKGGEEEDDYENYEGDDEADWEDVEESLEGEGEIALEEW